MSGHGDEAPNSNGVSPAGHETGVLAKLPRARPQRASARRDAARQARMRAAEAPSRPTRKTATKARTESAAEAGPDRRAKPRADRLGTRPPRRTQVAEEPVPLQGFECEGERESGPVQPPGGSELIGAAAEILGELAKAGVATGERLLKDAISLLPRS